MIFFSYCKYLFYLISESEKGVNIVRVFFIMVICLVFYVNLVLMNLFWNLGLGSR